MRAAFLAGTMIMATAGATAAPAGYPTEVLADYVFACMATNGETAESLRRCSCSIDHIASRIDFDAYAQAETVMRMQQMPGGDDRASMFRASPWATGMVDKLKQAQVEAETTCFARGG